MLTDEQKGFLEVFKDVTHETNDQQCIDTLEAFSWDLEAAINGFLATGHHAAPRPVADPYLTTATRRSQTGSTPRPPPFGMAGNQNHRFGARAPRAPDASSDFVGWIVYIIFMPLRLVIRIAGFIFAPLWAAIGYTEISLKPPTEEDLIQSAHKFARQFQTLYGFEHPEFFIGSYSQAVAKARQDLKPLVVYIHSDDHEDTNDFCRSILCSTAFREALRSNCIFWANSVKSTDGWRVAEALQVSGYPCISVMLSVDSQLRVVGKLEGLIRPEPYLERLRVALDAANAETLVAKNDRDERQMNQRLREEQDLAFKQSLEQDREKERKRKEEEDRKREEEERRLREEEDEQRQIEELDRRRREAFEAIPPEPSADEKDTTMLTIKMPDGQRLQRRFRHKETIQHVYDFVAGQDPEVFDIPHEFVLCSNFPRREFSDHSQTLADAKLLRAEMLMVDDLD